MEIDFNKVYTSNSYGDYKVIKDYGKRGKRHMIRVKFIKTGYEKDVRADVLASGKVKDRYLPTIYGVGYIGEYEMVRDKWYLYKTWHAMMSRCYNVNDKDYPRYGGAGVKVCDRWHCYANYFYDVQTLPNYELKEKYPNEYQLDKDYLQLGIDKSQRVYSPETCIWLSIYDNGAIRTIDNSNCKYFGVYPTGRYNDKYIAACYNMHIGTFTDPIAAANAYNYFYNKYNSNTYVKLVNDVPYMSPLEFIKYNTNPKTMCTIVKK